MKVMGSFIIGCKTIRNHSQFHDDMPSEMAA